MAKIEFPLSFSPEPDSSCASRRDDTRRRAARVRRGTNRDRACSHVGVEEADAPQGHRPRRQRVSQPIALPTTASDPPAHGFLTLFFFPLVISCGCGCGCCGCGVGSVLVGLILCWFDLFCRVGKTSLMNQYPWLDPPVTIDPVLCNSPNQVAPWCSVAVKFTGLVDGICLLTIWFLAHCLTELRNASQSHSGVCNFETRSP
jgi:hypothetical protein